MKKMKKKKMSERKTEREIDKIRFNKDINIHYKYVITGDSYRVLKCDRDVQGEYKIILLGVKNSSLKKELNLEDFLKEFKKERS